jgi:hypothetical protein
MAGAPSANRLSVSRLILGPAIITLAVTILRLVGEFQHWPSPFFNNSAGGGGAIIGIVWLAPVFGAYFAFKLARAGGGPASPWRAIGVALAGAVVILASNAWGGKTMAPYGFKAVLLFFWIAWALAGVLQFLGWPGLFKVLLGYSLAARVPVVIIMFCAFWGHWGTHYDALPARWLTGGLWSDFLWMGFFPQLMLWAGYTITAGAISGSITAGVMRLFQRTRAAS